MKILAIEKDLAPESDFTPELLRQEAVRAWELHQAGVIRELYFHQEQGIAVLILECADAAEAKTVLDTLPLVQAGLITFEIMPLVAYSGFARLFS